MLRFDTGILLSWMISTGLLGQVSDGLYLGRMARESQYFSAYSTVITRKRTRIRSAFLAIVGVNRAKVYGMSNDELGLCHPNCIYIFLNIYRYGRWPLQA